MEKQAELDLQGLLTNAKVLSPAIAATLAGTTGYLATSRGRARPGETEKERRMRILRNTLGMGVAGGAAGAVLPWAASLLLNAAPERDLPARLLALLPPEARALLGGGAGGALGWHAMHPDRGGGLASYNKDTAARADSIRDTRMRHVQNQYQPGTKAYNKAVGKVDSDVDKFLSERGKGAPSTAELRNKRLKGTAVGTGLGVGVGLTAPYIGEAMGNPVVSSAGGAALGGFLGHRYGPRATFRGKPLLGKHGGGLGALVGLLLGFGGERADEAVFKGNSPLEF